MKTRRNLRRTLRGGDPAVIGIVLGSVLAVGIGAMMYKHMQSRKKEHARRATDKDVKELIEHKPRRYSSDDDEFYDA